mmetsp:Transcript_31018/g.93844  ORF Transcript_31018/g.93844 Transcript_31018/m.93844 type:complete len:357 (+) Transcript_31018:898-1968(+)
MDSPTHLEVQVCRRRADPLELLRGLRLVPPSPLAAHGGESKGGPFQQGPPQGDGHLICVNDAVVDHVADLVADHESLLDLVRRLHRVLKGVLAAELVLVELLDRGLVLGGLQVNLDAVVSDRDRVVLLQQVVDGLRECQVALVIVNLDARDGVRLRLSVLVDAWSGHHVDPDVRGGTSDGTPKAHGGWATRLEKGRALRVAAVVGALPAVVDEAEPVVAAETPTIHIEPEHDIDVNLPILVTHWPLDSNPACVYPIRRDLALVALGDDSTIAHSYHACQLNGDVLVLPRSAESMVPVDRILWSEDLGQRERVRGDQRSRRPVALALGIELLLLIPMHRLVETKVSLHGRQLRTAAP